ncbi:MAG: glycosyltransferase family 4 protein [Chloroflexota bacterium]|nr:glycosyltransferase family 4 protein [Chloroflexota bacterium]
MDELGRHLRIAFLGSWVPRRCGIATFTRDLRDAIEASDPTTICGVVAIDEPGALRQYDPTLIARVRQADAASYRRAAAHAQSWGADVVSVQHEFGLYGSYDGVTYTDHLAGFLERLRVPSVVTLHTVLPKPEAWMRDTVRTIAGLSSAVIVMSATAQQLLHEDYGIAEPAVVIPHGAPPIARTPGGRAAAKEGLGLAGRTVVSTFGLVDPRKGLEYAIEALATVVRAHPDVMYVIAGQTHPELIRREGEAYRAELVRRVAEHGLQDHVRFIDEYLTLDAIVELLRASDAYVTPYLDPNQITSGTLAYAIGAGCAIVSTRYLHAAEALGDGRGLLVDFRSSTDIAAALCAILGAPTVRHALEEQAYAYGREATWPHLGAVVLAQLSTLAGRPSAAPTPLRPAVGVASATASATGTSGVHAALAR